MDFEIKINGKTMFKALAIAWVVNRLCKAISNIKKEQHVILVVNEHKEPKTSKKNEKVESK